MSAAPHLAVIGAGIAGMYAAWRLDALGYRVSLFERHGRPGGHTDTHSIDDATGQVAIDTGFIVFNRRDYPTLGSMFDQLGVRSQATSMSFSAHDPAVPDWAYAAGEPGGLFANRNNLWSLPHWQMLAGIVRFYRRGKQGDLLQLQGTLGDLLDSDFSASFAHRHLLPMVAALWSCSIDEARHYPLRDLIEYMRAHGMLDLVRRPQWETVTGGSARYIDALQQKWQLQLHCSSAVQQVKQTATDAGTDKYQVRVDGHWHEQAFDGVVFACAADQALAMLADAGPEERAALGSIGYSDNDTVLHTDASVMPPQRGCWASWNVRLSEAAGQRCTASYWMNNLQRLSVSKDYFVSLNQTDLINPRSILKQRHYRHPRYDAESCQARRQLAQFDGGRQRRWYCGAWTGWGFHEDGARSAERVVQSIQQQFSL
jgi:predicted NAD/FAD-binding protein